MRAALLLYSEFPNGPAFTNVNVDTWYFPVNLPGMSSSFLDERRKYARVGIMRNTHNDQWPDSPTDPVKFAERFSQDFTDLASPSFWSKTGPPKQCFGMYDGEAHDPAWHLAMFTWFRQLRNARQIIWTLESFQGGWFTPQLVSFINNDANLMVAPQCYVAYVGSMQPAAPEAVVQNLVDAGVRRDKITVFLGLRDEYGVKRVVPYGWDGLLYVENKAQNDTVSY